MEEDLETEEYSEENKESEESNYEEEETEEEPLENLIEESGMPRYPPRRERVSPWLEAKEIIPAENLEKELKNQITPAKPEIENEPQYSSKTYQTMGNREAGYPGQTTAMQIQDFPEPSITQDFSSKRFNLFTRNGYPQNQNEPNRIKEEESKYSSNFEQQKNRRRF